ncbi:ABC transporter permease [Fredinandcohnia sp. QZ13]|uniref:ABC transporter permease n=1 Tax=Fredinandcohnia sp. QZ13 TaxID=3073144 RepID=UPI00285338C6|nr:ABC transporter permease [Fredinandcohnia sp. QZ13]MDR4887640.1 ABC transporter permease [Fredinandcohnia sp. QZ13]
MLRKIYIKELKDCFRDRRTLILTVLLPILMMSGMTFFYENMMSDGEGETYQLAIEESSMDEGERILSGVENVDLIKSSNLEQSIQDGDAQGGLQLTPNFIEATQNGEEATVTLVGDSFSTKSTQLNTIIMNALAVFEKTVVAENLQEVGVNPSVMQPFAVEQIELTNENPNVEMLAFLIPLILSVAIGVGSGPSASDLFAGEKEKKTMEALLMTPVKRSTLLLAKWLTIATIGSVIAIITLGVVALEISLFTENLKNAVSFGDDAYLIIGIAILLSIIYAAFTASLIMITSIAAKTIKEAGSYSSPVMMIAMFPAMIIVGIGVNELTTYHFAVPIMNLFTLLKELMFGIINYEHILLAFGSYIACMIIFFVVGRIMFMKDKWVMN